jgi:hypothetical protein
VLKETCDSVCDSEALLRSADRSSSQGRVEIDNAAVFFCAIRAFTQLQFMRAEDLIENWYELQRNLSLQIAREFISEHLKQRMELNAYLGILRNSYYLPLD